MGPDRVRSYKFQQTALLTRRLDEVLGKETSPGDQEPFVKPCLPAGLNSSRQEICPKATLVLFDG